MLVLSRRLNESVVIPTPLGPIKVTLVEVRTDKARIGFDGPDAVKFMREEIMNGAPETCSTVWGTLPIGETK